LIIIVKFLDTDQRFFNKVEVLTKMIYFVGVINMILISIFDEKYFICFNKFNKKNKIGSIFINQDQIKTKKIFDISRRKQ